MIIPREMPTAVPGIPGNTVFCVIDAPYGAFPQKLFRAVAFRRLTTMAAIRYGQVIDERSVRAQYAFALVRHGDGLRVLHHLEEIPPTHQRIVYFAEVYIAGHSWPKYFRGRRAADGRSFP